MRKVLILFFLLAATISRAQVDTMKWARAFPITNYMQDVSDSVKLVQVFLPAGPLLRQRQVALLRGTYRDSPADTAVLGTGRCVLIKGTYYYFAIDHHQLPKPIREKDLLYVMVDKPVTYTEQIVRLAAHCIGLQNVYGTDLYDPSAVFRKWNWSDEQAILDSIINDIRFTGTTFLKDKPAMNVKVPTGKNKDKLVLNLMTECTRLDVTNFLGYMIARPRLYAGNKWKVSEIFATWLAAGSPAVIKDP